MSTHVDTGRAYEVGRRLQHHGGSVWQVTAANLRGDGTTWDDGVLALAGDYRIKCVEAAVNGSGRGREMRVHADYLHGNGWRPAPLPHVHPCSEPGCPGAECYAGTIDGCGHPTKSAADESGHCPWGSWPCGEADARHASSLRRRVLALIATECPGQDVAGVVVIEDALRIDFVSGAALLVGADGTLSWESAGPREEHCANCGAGQGEPCAAALHDECNCWPEPRP